MMKKCFLVLLTICFFLNLTAQTVAINNTPGAYSGNIVIGSNANNATEAIYLSSEIGNGNFTTGATAINRIEFSLNTLSIHPLPITVTDSFRIYLKNISASIKNFATGSTSYTGYTKVYDGSLSITTFGWNGVNLTTPFVRTDSSNLQILIVRNNSDSTNIGAYFNCSVGNINSIDTIPLGSRRYNGNTQFVANASTLTTSGFRPAIQLIHTSPILFKEDFNYVGYHNGDTIQQKEGWYQHSGFNATIDKSVHYQPTSLQFNGYAGSGIGGAANFQNSVRTEDINAQIPKQSTGSVYTAFMLKIDSSGGLDTLTDYFFHYIDSFGTNVGTNLRARLFVADGSNANKFKIGLSKGTGAKLTLANIIGAKPPQFTTTEYNIGQTYLVVVKYKFNTANARDDEMTLFVIDNNIPNSEPVPNIVFTDTGLSDLKCIQAIAIRQGAEGRTAGVIDGFRVFNNWDSGALKNVFSIVPTPCTATSSTTNATIAFGNSYLFNGTTYTSTGTYTAHLTNAAGCDSAATLNLTVTSTPPLAITGASTLCVGSQITLNANISGGVWSSGNNRASVNAAGVVTGASVGIAIIKYKLSNGNAVTHNITVNGKPNMPSIHYLTGTSNPQYGAGGGFCANKTFTVVGNPSGGVWSKTGVITVTTPAGVVNTGGVAGAGSLTYTYTNSNGCSNSRTISGNVVVCASRGVNGASSENLVAISEFAMYPNPATSVISLLVDRLIGTGTIVITDLYGKQVKAQALSIGNNTVDITTLSKGFYLVSVITSEGKSTKKLVVE